MGPPNNSFTVGKGDKVDVANGDIISQLFWNNSDQHFQNSDYNGNYIYVRLDFDDDVWMEIDVSQGSFSFKIYYFISKNEDNINLKNISSLINYFLLLTIRQRK